MFPGSQGFVLSWVLFCWKGGNKLFICHERLAMSMRMWDDKYMFCYNSSLFYSFYFKRFLNYRVLNYAFPQENSRNYHSSRNLYQSFIWKLFNPCIIEVKVLWTM